MPTIRNPRPAARPSARRLGLDFRRALIAGLGLILLLAGGAYFGWSPLMARLSITQQAREPAGRNAGAIVFVSPTGDRCRRKHIDNATGRITDDGVVDCDSLQPHAAGAGSGAPSKNRVEAVRDAFRNR